VRPIERSHRTIVAPRERDDNLVKEFGVGLYDVVPQRLEREPSSEGIASLLAGVARVVGVRENRCAGRLGQQLGLARSLHRDEPPRRFVDRLTNGEETVILMNGGLLIAQALGQNSATLLVEHDAPATIGDESVILEENAGVLVIGSSFSSE